MECVKEKFAAHFTKAEITKKKITGLAAIPGDGIPGAPRSGHGASEYPSRPGPSEDPDGIRASKQLPPLL